MKYDTLKSNLRKFQTEFDGIDLHPSATHLVFFDTAGHARGKHSNGLVNAALPYDHIHALKQALINRGAAEGLVLMNGGLQEVNLAMHYVSQLNPVVSFKNVGGASELVARIFQQEQKDRKEREWTEVQGEEHKDVEKAQQEVR
eukprot:COSAG02_NODE_13691_length_1361_cov_1.803487_2_plen_143_part_01